MFSTVLISPTDPSQLKTGCSSVLSKSWLLPLGGTDVLELPDSGVWKPSNVFGKHHPTSPLYNINRSEKWGKINTNRGL